jgi:hypothetical protein
MAMPNEDEPQAPRLERGPFSLHREQFQANGYSRVSGNKLQELFYAHLFKNQEHRERIQKEAGDMFCDNFFIAQLHHYSIEVPSQAGQARQALQEAVDSGKVSLENFDASLRCHS